MTIYDLVYELLRDYPALRSNDKKLQWSVYIKEGKVNAGKISMDDFLLSTSDESITRARRKVQEEHPELQAEPLIQQAREKKEEEAGTFVYREKVDTREPLTMDFEARMKLHNMAREELIKKGILKK